MENDQQNQPYGNNFPSQANRGLSGNNFYGSAKSEGMAGNNFGGPVGSAPSGLGGGNNAGISGENPSYNTPLPGSMNSATQKKLILMIAAVLLVAGAGVLYLFLRETPLKVLAAAASATKNIKTYSFDGSVKADSKTTTSYSGTGRFSFDIGMKGKIDQTDVNNIKTSANVKFGMSTSAGIGGAQEVSVGMDMVALSKNKMYYRLNDYNLGSIGIFYGGLVDPFKGNWYSVNADEMAKISPDSSVTPEMSKQITEIYSKYDFIKFKKDLGDANLNGIKTYHYQIGFDKNALLSYYLDIMKEQSLPSLKTEKAKKDYEDSINKAKTELSKPNKTIDDFMSSINTEVWIGKSDKIIYKIFVSGNFDEQLFKEIDKVMSSSGLGGGSSFSSSSNSDKSEISFELSFAVSDVNKPVSIAEPEGAKDLMQEFNRVLDDARKKVTASAESYTVDSDKDGLSDQMEKFYKTDPNNPDTDGDGYKDGDEVKNGFDPLSKKAGAKLKV